MLVIMLLSFSYLSHSFRRKNKAKKKKKEKGILFNIPCQYLLFQLRWAQTSSGGGRSTILTVGSGLVLVVLGINMHIMFA